MKTKLGISCVGFLAAFAVNACVIWPDDDDHVHEHEPDPYIPPAVYETIDADHVLDTDLGLGAGLFVEYGTGGRWTLWTSCDTDIGGRVCFWQANITAHSSAIYDLREYETEGGDFLELYGDSSMTWFAETDYDRDTIEFYADPGTFVEIEVLLDDYVAPEYFVWYGNGFVHNGASGSPVIFEPATP